jgi:hypothetical protein
MKIMRALMLVYQYAYYSLFESDKYLSKKTFGLAGTRSEASSRYKTICIFLILETVGLITLYDVVVHLILGIPVHTTRTPYPISIIVFLVILSKLTHLLVGHPQRTGYYRKIFDLWNKKKRLRWNICINFIQIMIIVVYYFVLTEIMKGSIL